MEHTYYIPSHCRGEKSRVCGDRKDDLEIVALLYATYLRHETGHVGRYDGASLVDAVTIDDVTHRNRLRVIVGCDGKNTGSVIDVLDSVPIKR